MLGFFVRIIAVTAFLLHCICGAIHFYVPGLST